MRWLRSVLFWIFVFWWTILVLGSASLASLLTLGLLRRRLLNLFAPLYGWPCLWIAGIRLSVLGREHVATPRARVLIFNHASFLEVLIFAALNVPRFCYLGKRSFAYIPVLGQAWWLLGGHFVDRRNRKKAHASIKRLGEELRRHGLSTAIAPEGTRSRTGELQPFKLGAFHLALDTGAPIVPMVFHGVHPRLRPDDWKVYPGTITVQFHPARDSAGWRREQLRTIAQELQDEYQGWIAAGPPPASAA